MYMDDIKLFAKNAKEWETLKQTVRIYHQDIRKKCGMSTFVVYLMPKLALKKISSNTIQHIVEWISGTISFLSVFVKK